MVVNLYLITPSTLQNAPPKVEPLKLNHTMPPLIPAPVTLIEFGTRILQLQNVLYKPTGNAELYCTQVGNKTQPENTEKPLKKV